MIHVNQCFQAVGHGTFFTGLLHDSKGNFPDFSWVYDCGSKRTTRINQAINKVVTGWLPKKIDLLVLSHFDDDHVNGVEQLLRACSVRHLALPYMDAAQQLAQAASVTGDICSASTALFQLDPIAWLNSRGISDRVDFILYVRGGTEGGNTFPDDEPSPLPLEERTQDFSEDKTNLQLQVEPRTPQSGKPGPSILYWQHAKLAAAGQFPIELTFFNSQQPDLWHRTVAGERVARRSGKPLGLLQMEINSVVHKYGMTNLMKQPRKGWREKLRGLYDSYFGNSGQARNDISLCLLIMPRRQVRSCCNFFKDHPLHYRVHLCDRSGLLCLGDLRMDHNMVNAMKNHFGSNRWTKIAAVQIPHHGSRHSWESGIARAIDPCCFVHCVLTDSANHNHPHAEVESDLNRFHVLRANYDCCVVLNYCFP